MRVTISENGIPYHLAEDGMYYPDLRLPQEETPHFTKYGCLRKAYLKEHQPALYAELLMSGWLVAHLNAVDAAAREQVDRIVRQMAKAQGVDEALKARDQMTRVGLMNNLRNAAEEDVLNRLIYN